jgi:type IV pilus assembly protein PilB
VAQPPDSETGVTVCPKCQARYATGELPPGKKIQCKHCKTVMVVGRATEIVDRLLEEAILLGASDVHIEPMADKLRVRLRIDGVLTPHMDLGKNMQPRILSRIKLLSDADIAEKRLHQDGRFQLPIYDNDVDVRMSSYVTVNGENIVLRILNKQVGILPLEGLGMPPRLMTRYVDNALDAASGIVIITGPTGSGKTTTLYSSISHCNGPGVKISTAEDPVEYQIDGIMQCAIKDDIGLTFPETIKALVRQDPDIVVLGEVRDAESAQAAVMIALTGHQVFTTFHTEDSVGAMLRLIEMGVEPYLITSTVCCVVGQRLVRRICPHCVKDSLPKRRSVDMLGIDHSWLVGRKFRRGTGCDQCNQTGFRGRVGLYEALFPTDELRQAVLDRQPSYAIRNQALASGKDFFTLKEAGIVRALMGETTLEEIWTNAPRSGVTRPLTQLFEMTGNDDPLRQT